MLWFIKFNKQNTKQDKQKIMRTVHKGNYPESNFSQTLSQFQQIANEMNQPYSLSRSRAMTQRQQQKTEQPPVKHISPNAIKLINEQLYQIIHMDPSYAQNTLRKVAKQVYELVDNELLFNIKHLSNMKLLLYSVILSYVDEFSMHQRLRNQTNQKQKSSSIGSSKNISTLKQQDISLQGYNGYQNSRQLLTLKQTVPFVPKDKSKLNKNTRIEMLEEQLAGKIESTKQSLENILKKIEFQANYRLSGEDIMRLKKSVINVSELKPCHFLNLHTLNPTQPPKPSQNIAQGSRPQSRDGRQQTNILSDTQSMSMSRAGSRSKTYTGGFKDPVNSTCFNTRTQDVTSDEEGNKLLIEQLQQIIERKENRIKQLTKELSKNLSDQKELEKAIQNFEVEIHEIQSERKNFRHVIEKLQEENLNFQLEIKELKDALILKKEASKLSAYQHEEESHYNVIKEFQTKQRMMKFNIRKQVELTVESTFSNIQNESREKDINSLSGGSPFNDISEITPKRQNIEESYILQSNVVTTRKNITPEVTVRQRPQHNRSSSKYQIISGSRTQSKGKRDIDLYASRSELKDIEKENLEKILFLQALTIEQMLQDM